MVTATIQNALVGATAKGTAAGVITLRVVTLAEELLRGMVLAKAKLFAAVLLAVSLVTGSAGVLTHRTLVAQPPDERQAPRSTALPNRIDLPPDQERPARPLAQERPGNDALTARDEPHTRIVGVVADEAGQPVAGARVNVTWRRKASEDVQTATDGSFSLRLGFPTRRGEVVHASTDGGARQGYALTARKRLYSAENTRIFTY